MLPTSRTSARPPASTLAVNDDVVLLPLVPVTPTIRPGLRSKKMLVADVTHLPAALAAVNSGSPVGTPGERTMVSYGFRCSR